jgi:hypothetical protein
MTGKTALDVRKAIEQAHPEIHIVTPLSSASGKWELAVGEGDTALFDDFWAMVDVLAGQFQDVAALLAESRSAAYVN